MRPLFLLLLLPFSLAAAPKWTLLYEHNVPQVAFAVQEIKAAGGAAIEVPANRLVRCEKTPCIVISSRPAEVAKAYGLKAPANTSPQSYAIRRKGTTIAVLGADAAGAMYGGLDVAEAFRHGTLDTLGDSDHSPHIEKRGIKFNVPLDVRTPSYSDNSDAAQQNIPEMWSMDFWREFIDDMARHRFNVLTLWSLHPFPSMVKVPEFPDVALDDVQRTRVPMDDTYSHSGSDMVRPELLRNVEVVRKMTIAQKTQFWRDVMQYAHDHGIETYVFTWNLFTFGAEGKHGITAAQDNPRTIEYFRASVREMVLAYPLLAGFGITAGERMQNRKDEFSKEKWLWKAYGEGVRDALKRQPGRSVRMIHRYHQTSQDEIEQEWKDYPGPFDLSFKYAIAHMYSIPNPPFIRPALPHLSPARRTWLTVRDDDYYSFRWGDPRYARDFIRNMPGADKVVGFYMGPDGTIWGRESLSKEPEQPRQTVIRKRWYGFMLWGRLSYEPGLPDALFERAIAARFPEASPAPLASAWAEASRIFPRITSFFWGDIDLRWFPEACLSHPRHKGFYTVRHFIEGGTMPGSGIMDIVQWRQSVASGRPANGTTPLLVADALEGDASATLKLLDELRPKQGSNKELRLTLGDLDAMSWLGHYYAAKIRGAAELALFDKTSEPARRDASIRHLQLTAEHWKRYAAAYTRQYEQPKLYNRVGWVNIPALSAKVEEDIAMARAWTPGTVPDTAPPRQADTPFRK